MGVFSVVSRGSFLSLGFYGSIVEPWLNQIHPHSLNAPSSQYPWDLVIVGGGAAGFFAAATAGEAWPGARILILERGNQVLSKVSISGGGRCNVTHACEDPHELTTYYPRGSKELLGPFYRWGVEDTRDWFEGRGVELKTESDGRVFPCSDRSQSVVDCLRSAVAAVGARVRVGTQVRNITASQGRFELELGGGEVLRSAAVLVASGGLKPGPLMTSLQALGHTIEPLAPSLFTFPIRDPRISDLAGVSVAEVGLQVEGAPFQSTGPMLVTHWGLSGPAVLRLSAWGARWMQAAGYQWTLRVNWVGGRSMADTAGCLKQQRDSARRRQISKTPLWELPRRLWVRLVEAAGMKPVLTWGQMSSAQMESLARQLVEGTFRVRGKSMNKEEFVTCGGVRLAEVDFRRMESRVIPGLYFAGEVLDIDALTGGFNFQAAWTTGRLAGEAVGESG